MPSGKYYAIQHPTLHQHLHRAEHGGASQLRIGPPQLVPEVVGCEILAIGGQRLQTLRDQATLPGISQSHVFKHEQAPLYSITSGADHVRAVFDTVSH